MRTYEIVIRARIIASPEHASVGLLSADAKKPSITSTLLMEAQATMNRLARDPHIALLPNTLSATITAESDGPAYVRVDKPNSEAWGFGRV